MAKFDKIDIRGGQMTYAQRIRVGEILTSGEKEHKIFRQIFECLCDGYEPRYTQEELQYVMEVVEGIRYWIERESKELSSKPSADEVAAGIHQLTNRTGYMATLVALGEKFGCDPDEVLGWKYGKVFNILLVNKENAEFSRRYSDVLSKKKRK